MSALAQLRRCPSVRLLWLRAPGAGTAPCSAGTGFCIACPCLLHHAPLDLACLCAGELRPRAPSALACRRHLQALQHRGPDHQGRHLHQCALPTVDGERLPRRVAASGCVRPQACTHSLPTGMAQPRGTRQPV